MRLAAGRTALAALAVLFATAGCGGPGQAKPAVSSSASASVPAPTGSACAAGGDLGAISGQGLIDAVKKVPALSTYAQYAEVDSTRAGKFNALRGVTVFAPTDDAWTALDEPTAAKLQDDAWKSAVVEYSITPEQYLPKQLESGEVQAMPTFRAAGSTLFVTPANGVITLNGESQVTCGPIAFGGGVIYLTNRVLLPPT